MIIQLIAELGGGAAIMRLLLGMWAKSQERQETRRKDSDKVAQRIQETFHGVIEFVIAGLAVCSFVLLLSTVLLPLFTKSIEVVYLLSESRSFLFFDWSKLREYSWGNAEAEKRIVILPFQVAICTNFVSWVLTGRAMRTR
jgi:hypothetical protein